MQAPIGFCITPNALRACLPASPNTSPSSSLAAVGDHVLFGEFGRGVDQAGQLDDALDAAQVAAAGGLQRAHQVDDDRARGLLAFFDA